MCHRRKYVLSQGSANFNVGKITLMRSMKKEANPTCTISYQATILNNQIFLPGMEQQLSSHIVYLDDILFGLSVEKCKKLAFQFQIIYSTFLRSK